MIVIRMICAFVGTMAPPADILYPVEPVGVDKIRPSPQKVLRYSPLTRTRRLTAVERSRPVDHDVI